MIHVFTILPEEHIILYISGFCTCDCSKDVMKGCVADHLALLFCEQTGKHPKVKDCGEMVFSSQTVTRDQSHGAVGSDTMTAISILKVL